MRWSLGRRVFLGALFWTTGLFILSGLVLTAMMARHRGAADFVHGAFSHLGAASFLALACLAAGLWYVRRGLSPVAQLRARLAAVHSGAERRVAGSYPAEVQPLVDDVNQLLEHQDTTMRRAVDKAGDLAHGLKTPLALLAREAETARASGNHALADSITQQVDRMQRQIDHHLAHARAAASGAVPGARTPVVESAEGLVRTMQRLYADKRLAIDCVIDRDHAVRAHRHDLDEMLGNLLDNACKWSASRVHLESSATATAVVMVVEDDGPGIAETLRQAVLQRGIRADETAPGSGFGLAIVRDLAELHGGRITLDSSPLGGLQARLELPPAPQ